jgi:hypothetical protein
MSTTRIAPLHAARDPSPPFVFWDPDEAAKCEKRQSQSSVSLSGALRNAVSFGPIGFLLVLSEKIWI